MKEIDFENAIHELNDSIIIDEIKIHHCDVRQAIGHNGRLKIVWNNTGQAFTAPLNEEKYFIYQNSDDKFGGDIGVLLNRSEEYDLIFRK